MKSKFFLIALGTGFVLALLISGVVGAERTIRYADYSTSDLVRLVGILSGMAHSKAAAVEAGFEALSRNLMPDQDALVRYRMAQAYKALPNGGPLAKEKYGEVLKLHPTYERNHEIALRLGQLNDTVIMPGTERNVKHALECFNYLVQNYSDANDGRVYTVVMQAHMHLGELYAQLCDYPRSNEHYEAIYNFDPNLATRLPDDKSWLYDDIGFALLQGVMPEKHIGILKDALPERLVRNCIRQDLAESLAELDGLMTRYSNDPNITELAREAMLLVCDVDKIAGDAINDPNGSPSESRE